MMNKIKYKVNRRQVVDSIELDYDGSKVILLPKHITGLRISAKGNFLSYDTVMVAETIIGDFVIHDQDLILEIRNIFHGERLYGS